ncbi:MAG: YggT family protein [Alphaproteobacteria bacterium]|nr:YggT family protein [Alphaproteobacteria bacterium]
MHSLIDLIGTIINLYMWLIIAYVIMNWLINLNIINTSIYAVQRIYRFLTQITEPALQPIRKIIPYIGGIDISPVILILLLYFARNLMYEIFI